MASAERKMIVLELFRRGAISSGKTRELLGTPRLAFLHLASRLGIPFFDMTEDGWGRSRPRSGHH